MSCFICVNCVCKVMTECLWLHELKRKTEETFQSFQLLVKWCACLSVNTRECLPPPQNTVLPLATPPAMEPRRDTLFSLNPAATERQPHCTHQTFPLPTPHTYTLIRVSNCPQRRSNQPPWNKVKVCFHNFRNPANFYKRLATAHTKSQLNSMQ